MTFFSFSFIVFIILCFLFYWTIFNKTVKLQNIFLLIVSYLFYGLGSWKGLLLLILCSIVTHAACKLLSIKTSKRKIIASAAITINLLVLCFFKYCNFFIDSVISLLTFFDVTVHLHKIKLFLPLGISFFTFSSISYIVDCYSNKIKSTDIITSCLYLAFFPAILSGPIHKGTSQIPQWIKKRHFNYKEITYGLKLILWGTFIKLVIADKLGAYVDGIYASVESYSGSTLFIASILYTFQIYADFAGYSSIAIGCGNLFGIKLQENFRRPYFARSITEFWSRWHMSLTSFFRNYLYIPLGGNRVSRVRWIFNIMFVFFVSGLWHGASYTFIIWGCLHGVTQIIEKLIYNDKLKHFDETNQFVNIFRIVVTFIIVSFAWIFFRMPSLESACSVIYKIFTDFSLSTIFWGVEGRIQFGVSILLLSILMIKDFIQEYFTTIEHFWEKHRTIRWTIYYVLCLLIVIYGMNSSESFIYYQF